MGRQFLEKWSLPVSELTTAHVRRLIAEVGAGRASSTEGRRWGDMRTVLRWWVNEDLIEERVITRVGRVRGTVIEPPGEDDPVGDQRKSRSAINESRGRGVGFVLRG